LQAVRPYLQSAWDDAIIPTAVAVAAVLGFWKLLLEKQKLQLEIDRLRRDAPSAIHRPTTDEIQAYSHASRGELEAVVRRLQHVRTAIRTSALLVVILLPASVYLSTSRGVMAPPIPRVVVFDDVYFREGDFVLDDKAKRTLDSYAAALRDEPDVALTIEGNTRSTGTAEENLALGERRANEVRDYLITIGVKGDRLATVSYGEERPKYDNNSEDTRALNDRVSLQVQPGKATE
jgi:peptidoglycan-associated lipoprotein